MKVGKLLTSWNPCDIIEHEVEYMREQAGNEEFDEDKAWEIANEDDFLFEMEWDDICEYLTELINQWNPNGYWYAKVNNFGWCHQNGYKNFRALKGETLLQEILPKTDCIFTIYRYGRKGFAINNAHHDAPSGGEWYYITKGKEN